MSYPGGKGRIYQELINLMPPHDAYIETFLGDGAVMRRKRPAARNIGIDVDERVIRRWLGRPPAICELHCADSVVFLQNFTFHGGELVYCDPPYLMETRRGQRRLYRHEFGMAGHEALLDVISSIGCAVMISGRQSDLYSQRLHNWHRVDLQNVTQAGKARESLWLNYDPPEMLHDYRFLGATFRERQRIGRRLARLSFRLRSLPAVERNALRERVWTKSEEGNGGVR